MNNSNDTDYEIVQIPDSEDPTEYHYTVRRAEILQYIKQRGNPYSINKRRLADRYDVHPSSITRDFQRLAEYIDDLAGKRAKATARLAMEKAVTEAQENDNYTEAYHIARDWASFLQSTGDVERAPMQADITHREAETETEDYAIIDAEGEPVETEHDALVSGSDAEGETE